MMPAPANRAGVCRATEPSRGTIGRHDRPTPYPEDTMLFRNRTLILVASTLAFSASTALAQTSPAKTPTPQQQRMAECSAANKGKTGDDYKSSMSSCLKGEKPAASLTPQQQRMKDCNAQAGKQSLAGDQRKAFMSNCLKGKS
jgi:hypothetical protein